MNKVPFLVFEGVEGSGKTTQLSTLSEHLRSIGRRHVLTKEPGGTPLGDRIRAILLDPGEEGMDPLAELLLYAASRRQHVVEVIRPALETGVPVLCDRFTDATLAYQGYGRTLQLDLLQQLNEWVTGSVQPTLTVVLDVSEEAGLRRARDRNAHGDLHHESRLEGEDLAFHRRVREGYLALARSDESHYAVVDATGDADEVFKRIFALLEARVPALFE